MYCLSFDKTELQETYVDRSRRKREEVLVLLTVSCVSAWMPLKKLLAYTPNFRIQANTSRLPTSYPVHLFARSENEHWEVFFS